MDTQISLLKTKVLYANLIEEFKILTQLELEEYIDSELNIDYKIIFEKGIDLELLEFISRFLIRIEYLVNNSSCILIGIKNTPENFQEYLAWFIKFFGYLEATEFGNSYSYNSFHREVFENKFCKYKFDTENMKFAIEKIEISFR
jgi:hypothetical protein